MFYFNSNDGGSMKYRLCVLILFLFQMFYVQADSREEFVQNLSTACQNEDVDQLFEMFSVPLRVMLSDGKMIRISSKEDFLNNLDRIFVDEFVEICSQWEQNMWVGFSQPSVFKFINLVNLEGSFRINVIDIGSIIRNQSNIFLNFLSSASLSTDECEFV